MSTASRPVSDAGPGGPSERTRTIGVLLGAALVWAALYALNEYIWDALVGWLGLDLQTRVVGAVHFFLYDTVKIFLLLTGLMFVVGMLRASLDLDKARDYLQGRGLFVGLVLAVVLGVVTPFCSCSSIPLFIGFVAAGIPLSITLTFLIASPLISEIAAIMIGDQFGWHIAAVYVAAGSVLSLVIGWIFSRFDLSRWVEPMVFATKVWAPSSARRLKFGISACSMMLGLPPSKLMTKTCSVRGAAVARTGRARRQANRRRIMGAERTDFIKASSSLF